MSTALYQPVPAHFYVPACGFWVLFDTIPGVPALDGWVAAENKKSSLLANGWENNSPRAKRTTPPALGDSLNAGYFVAFGQEATGPEAERQTVALLLLGRHPALSWPSALFFYGVFLAALWSPRDFQEKFQIHGPSTLYSFFRRAWEALFFPRQTMNPDPTGFFQDPRLISPCSPPRGPRTFAGLPYP